VDVSAHRAPGRIALAGRDDAVHASLVSELVDSRLGRFFDVEAARWGRVHPELSGLVGTLRRFVEGGGKRMRASFCYLGWWAALPAGCEATSELDPVIDVAAAIELLHAFALIHDDVMDGSDLRRGRPAVHKQLEADHVASGWRGEGRRFGEGMAVLLGDVALSWADCLLAPHRPLVGAVWDELRVELTMGQYLDMLGAAQGASDACAARLVATLKSGHYSVMRPLQLGAALAGCLDRLGPAYAAFGAPIGEAFQLRDDLLGVYGEPDVTGKPAGEDLREGKATLLVAIATASAPVSAAPLLARLGDPELGDDEVARFRRLFHTCGATAAVEAAISTRVEVGLHALANAPIRPDGRRALAGLARDAAWRVC
jgi:geranylgeranyl diphosphate synthase type I